MDALEILGTALGLTMLAGINLYLTVFVTGLAIRLGWFTNYPQGLEVLADPIVLVVAGVFLVMETIADKCPYIDNAWDAIHTVIRPVGGMLIALQAVGDVHPVAQVVAVLIGGSVAFTSHAAKAGTRLLVNTSPEPVSNIVVSTAEDVFVIGGAWFVMKHPVWALVIVVTATIAFWYFAPKFSRMIRAHAVAIWHRFRYRSKGAEIVETGLKRELPSFAHETWLTLQRGDEEIAWTVPCYSGRIKNVGRFVRGCLVATSDRRLFFIGRKWLRTRFCEVAVDGATVLEDPGAIFHRLSAKNSDGESLNFRLTRRYSPFVPLILAWWVGAKNDPGSQVTEHPVELTAGIS